MAEFGDTFVKFTARLLQLLVHEAWQWSGNEAPILRTFYSCIRGRIMRPYNRKEFSIKILDLLLKIYLTYEESSVFLELRNAPPFSCVSMKLFFDN